MDASTLRDDLAGQFFAEAKDDLVGLWEIVREVEQRSRPDGDVREEARAVVRELLARGLQAGDPPYSAEGYQPWADQAPEHVIERIRREWLALGRTPNIPDIVWFGPKP